MKALGLLVLGLVLAGGWWLWQRAGADVLLNAFIQWCG
jgi:hypothetical protein